MLMILFSSVSAQIVSIVSELLKCDSIVVFDASDNRVEKAVYNYTKQGCPVMKEYYQYKDGGSPVLMIKAGLANDKGNEFTILDSILNNGTWTIMENQYNLDNFGNSITKTVKTSQGTVIMDFIIHYGINNRIDSFFITLPPSGMTVEKYTYTYDANDLLILMEKYSLMENSTIYTEYTYIHNTDNKLEGKVSESFTYTNGSLNRASNRKEVLFYDNLERPLRNETYTWNTVTNNYKEQYDTYSIRYYKANTGIANHGKELDMSVTIVTDNELLTIESPVSETIEIYSIVGSCMYTQQKSSGQTTVFLSRLSNGIYIVRGSSGWTKKIFLH
jgi:hypothetical protein